jgi:hypothetical protein
MHYIVKDILDEEELNYLINYYDSREHYVTQGMEKLTVPLDDDKFMAFVNNLIQNKLKINGDYKVIGDNYYKHSISYFPHCDATTSKAWLNIVIPLKQYMPFGVQQFIVFDQRWQGTNITWLGSYELPGEFFSNKKTNQRPVDCDLVTDTTDTELPDTLWQQLNRKYLSKDYFYGMSGTSYDWIPGDIIIFDTQHIHATGNMKSKEKLGLSVRIEKL